MDGAFLLFLFIPALFGAVFLILALGFRSIEQERAAREADETAESDKLIPIPRFFARAGRGRAASPAEPVEDAVLHRVQRYLRDEQALADEFVSEPTVERLYRRTGKERRAS